MKAPNVNLKDILAKLSVLKSNLSLLLPIIIAVVGLLLVVPTRILSARLRATVEKTSVNAGKGIDQLDKDLSSKDLKIVSQKYLDAAAQDANDCEKLMDQSVKRELLSYVLFPDTNDQSRELFDQFGQRYREGVAALIQSLKPGESPTTAEIQTALASVPRPVDAAGGYGYALGGLGGAGAYQGTGLTLDSLTDAQRKMIDQLCTGKAREARIYASLADVAGYADWSRWTFENRDNAFRDCWYWQLGYWVIEDVAATIQQMNGSAESVVTAPVKRLMNVSFTFRKAGLAVVARPYGGGGGARAATERPPYVISPIKGVLVTPCTGRVCNGDFDVIHFDLQVVVDATQVVPFMQALCSAKEHRFCGFDGKEPPQTYKHNQITILETTMRQIESRDVNHLRYRYGDRPMVELELICEYLFNKTPAYEGLKPAQVKADLGGQSSNSGVPSPAPSTSRPSGSKKAKNLG
jgi:hypothetical protein